MMRAIPNATVLYPCDAVSAEHLVAAAAGLSGTTYIRTSRPATPVLYANTEEFPVGGSKLLRSSAQDDVTVVAAGVTLHEALSAYEILQADGVMMRRDDVEAVFIGNLREMRSLLESAMPEVFCVRRRRPIIQSLWLRITTMTVVLAMPC